MTRTRAFVVSLLLLSLATWAAAPSSAQTKPAPTPKAKYDAQGNTPPSEEVTKAAAAPTNKACLELRNSSQTWKIEVNFNPATYPFTITSGTIKGTICQASTWSVTGTSMGGTLKINATRPAGGGCASKVTIVGNFQNPPSYKGTYGFDGASTPFPHTTLFLGYTACP
jgi:hypothetical protein